MCVCGIFFYVLHFAQAHM